MLLLPNQVAVRAHLQNNVFWLLSVLTISCNNSQNCYRLCHNSNSITCDAPLRYLDIGNCKCLTAVSLTVVYSDCWQNVGTQGNHVALKDANSWLTCHQAQRSTAYPLQAALARFGMALLDAGPAAQGEHLGPQPQEGGTKHRHPWAAVCAAEASCAADVASEGEACTAVLASCLHEMPVLMVGHQTSCVVAAVW